MLRPLLIVLLVGLIAGGVSVLIDLMALLPSGPGESAENGSIAVSSVVRPEAQPPVDPWAAVGLAEPSAGVQPKPRLNGEWSAAERGHWAWQPLVPPQVPTSCCPDWGRTPIDAFIGAKLDAKGVAPLPPATPAAAVRRIALALTGLPPRIAVVKRFAVPAGGTAEDLDRRLDSLVDELLADPAYGEHQGRQWLDLVRYADTNGYEDDGLKPLAWQYRDFVIRCLNDDLPYDEFLRKQLAGDLMPTPTDDDFIAAGFLRLGEWDAEPGDPLKQRFAELDDVVSAISLVCLGLSVGCARCHDHPAEPISTEDYYGMVAMVQGLSRPRDGRLEAPAPSATPARLAEAEAVRQRQQQLRRLAFTVPDKRRAAALRSAAADLDASATVESAYRFVDTSRSGRPLRVLRRGDPRQPGPVVAATPPSVLLDSLWPETDRPRLALADWLVGERRSLTARLIVNRVWAWHFGRGLCETPANFGLSGSSPVHPELLTWLAHWFVTEADWSLKRLHRLIVTSRTFRTRCVDARTPALLRQYWGGFPRRRLRAEVIHDTLVTLAGRRSGVPPGGPPDRPVENREVQSRRAIYGLVRRNTPPAFLRTFDMPTAAAGCVLRPETHTTNQALLLWNSDFVDGCACDFAARIVREVPGNVDAQIGLAFRLVLGRPPRADEVAICRRLFPEDWRVRPAGLSPEQSSLQDLAVVLFNLNEFVFSN